MRGKDGEHRPMTNAEFSKLVADYQGLVFTVCHRLVADYHEAQNLTQETFLSAYQHIDRCEPENYKPWLARIAANKAKDYLKSAYNRHTVFEHGPEEGPSLMDTGQPILGQRTEDVVRDTEGNETVDAIRQAVLALKEPYHKVSVLYFLEEKDVEEISVILNRPRKTVQTQIYRAKQILQKALKGEVLDGTGS